jgi:hypothetical protein
MKQKWISFLAAGAVLLTALAPVSAEAKSAYDRRQEKKNEWRNIGTAAAALGILGLVKKDSTLTFVGATGALYSAYRYEEDRKSQNKMNKYRYQTFKQGYFYKDGKKYKRYTTWKNGKKYYYFKRV